MPRTCPASRAHVSFSWNHPDHPAGDYANLPLFARSLGRLSDLSARLATAELVIDEPAHVLWKEKRPLVRKFKLSADEWLVLAVNPWQTDEARSQVSVPCGRDSVELSPLGRHTGMFLVRGARATSL